MDPSPRPRPHARPGPDPAPPGRRDSLWQLVVGPTTWALHFLLAYVTAAIACAKAPGPWSTLDGTRVALWAYTAIALAVIAGYGWRNLQRHRQGGARRPHDGDTAGDRHRFLGFASLLLCGLSFVAVLYSALVIAVFGTCR